MQYYNLIHLGFAGYREVMENCLRNARLLSKSLEATGWYVCLSDIHRPVSHAENKGIVEGVKEGFKSAVAGADAENKSSSGTATGEGETSADYIAGLPVVSFRFTDEFKREFPHIKQETVSLLLRARQWIIPNYALPPDEDKTEILRAVVRESMSIDLLDQLVTDIVQVTETLMGNDEVDLSILQKQQRRGPTKKEGGTDGKDQAEEGQQMEKSGGEKTLGEDIKRMADGIHRSVC